jgi:hypothetical protein
MALCSCWLFSGWWCAHVGSLQAALHYEMDTGAPASTTLERQLGMMQGSLAADADGGYPWSCGGMPAAKVWLTRFVANFKHSHILLLRRCTYWIFENLNAATAAHFAQMVARVWICI